MSYKKRLRAASFISPSEKEYIFLTNTLIRQGGKKSSTQEIIDSNESITQDQGNKTYSFPISAYFTGADYDQDIDKFVVALQEDYTLALPGILVHPRWGNINVFPTSWEQKEELVNGNMIGRLEITFVEVFPTAQPTSAINNYDQASANIDALSSVSLDTAAKINLDTLRSQTNIIAQIRGAVGTITSAINEFTENIEEIQKTIDTINSDINGFVDDIGNSITLAVSSVQTLIRAPGRFIENTLNRINGYASMIEDLAYGILVDSASLLTVDQRNNSIMMQLVVGFAVASMAEAASNTNYKIRSETIKAIEKINETLTSYDSNFELSRTTGKVSQEFSGDHNFYSLLVDTVTLINQNLLVNAFSLKAEKKYTLKNSSDILTECYKSYGNVKDDTVQFFMETNGIKNNEFIELSTGYEVVVYV